MKKVSDIKNEILASFREIDKIQSICTHDNTTGPDQFNAITCDDCLLRWSVRSPNNKHSSVYYDICDYHF